MDTTFTKISNVIKNRRSVEPVGMNGNKIPNGHVAALLQLADWAPTHAFTEPWRFIAYKAPSVFCAQHAKLYKQNNAEADFNPAVYNNLQHQGDKASHVIVAIMKRSS